MKRIVALVCALGFSLSANAQVAGKFTWQDVGQRLKASQAISPLGDNFSGEQVSLSNGALSFSATDVSLPGNDELPVAFSRNYVVKNRKDYYSEDMLADWSVELPSISGVFSTNWEVSGSTPGNRCSSTNLPPIPPGGYSLREYWQGVTVDIPGRAGGDMLIANAGISKPTTGGPYPWVTGDGTTHIACLATIKNGSGEGFIATTADGARYWFDWMAQYTEPGLKGNQVNVGGTPIYASLARRRNVLLATRVQDRFGNSVDYTYTNAWNEPAKLTKILASDGRQITVTYSGGYISSVSDGSRSWSYSYQNSSGGRKTLVQVALPDSSAWNIGFSQFTDAEIKYNESPGGEILRNCMSVEPPQNPESKPVGTITHPSGGVGTFTVNIQEHGRSWVPISCSHVTTNPSSAEPGTGNVTTDDLNNWAISDNSFTLEQKRISGTGLQVAEWNYDYIPEISVVFRGGGNFEYPVCSSGAACALPPCTSEACAKASKTTVTGPGGEWTQYSYGNTYLYNEGKLLKVESGNSATDILNVVTNTYDLSSVDQVYPAKYGESLRPSGDGFPSEYHRPLLQSTTSQGGANFNYQVNTFDGLARPLTVVKWSSGMAQNFSRTDATQYYDNLGKWVVGQVAKITCVAPTTALPSGCGAAGTVISETTYDPTYALPLTTKSFGKLQQTLTYDTTSTVASGQLGTLKTVADGNNNITTLSSWKRGIPQAIKYPITTESPSGATQSAVVNDAGWITSVTDENGYKTCYGYDSMGRVSLITYPSETQLGVCDTSTWAATSIAFAGGNAAAYGMPAGHWRQTTLTGNGRKILIFDALWRPVVEQTLDLGNVSGTLSEVVKRYDVQGRVEFQSYPMNTNGLANYADTTLKGVWTDYDALDRVTSVTQDSELGLLTTLTEYLTGFKTRVTNPKLQQTTTSYLAYDQPSYDMPVAITHPEGAFTDITRDVFGKPTVLTRRNSASSLAVTRSYAYNANQELCRSVEPETGATLTGYDAAGNLKWSAAGLPATTACEANGTSTAVAARRADRTYDARNRVKSLSFPGGLGNTTYAYTPDGLPSSVVTDNGATDGQATLNYLYNKRRLMTRETLITPALDWPLTYTYNANGHLSAQIWHGLNIDYAPNALGQPTQAGTYASGVSYYPNGAIKQFTYGNGIVHTMTQNARQLPSRSTDSVSGSTPLDLGYAYDKHANVSGITDYLTGSRQTRSMTYDNLDRLTQTTSSMFGTATYGYNVLDNLTTVNVAGGNKARNHAYVYDANNRLANVTTGVGGPTVVGLGYDVQGNLANKSGVLYSFDYGNRLRTVTDPDPVAAKTSTYAYDGQGRRVKDLVNGVVKHSQYTQGGQLVMVADERANKVSEYVYLQGSLIAIRERDVPTAAYTTKYLHTDALGTPIAMTSQSRTLLETSEYEPFGQQVNAVGAPKDGPGYTGHVQDAATGLTYMQQRYYDPMIGMMLSVDPVTVLSNPVDMFHRYRYANNNPYRFTDPDGRAPKSICEQNPARCKAVIQVNPSSRGAGGDGKAPSRGDMMSRPVASTNSGDYDHNDPTFHQYNIGPSSLCREGPGCSVKSLAPMIDADSAPMFGEVKQGFNVLHMNNPIIHSSFFASDGSFYMTNATTSDHDFHAGAVVSRLYSSGGYVNLQTSGFGYSKGGATVLANYVAGYLYFGVWQMNVVGAAKINSGQMSPPK